LFLYQFLYRIFSKLRLTNVDFRFVKHLDLNEKLKLRQQAILIGLAFTSFLTVLYINNFSILSMLIRGGEFKEQVEEVESSTIMLLVNQIIRPIAFISFLYFISVKVRNVFVSIILFILALLTCSPLGMPRFAAAAMYIP